MFNNLIKQKLSCMAICHPLQETNMKIGWIQQLISHISASDLFTELVKAEYNASVSCVSPAGFTWSDYLLTRVQQCVFSALWVYNLYLQLTKHYLTGQGHACCVMFDFPHSDMRQNGKTSADFSKYYPHTHTHFPFPDIASLAWQELRTSNSLSLCVTKRSDCHAMN